jgi:hypothetical protein
MSSQPKRVRVVVSSSDRDVSVHPSASAYDADLPADLFNVHAITLVSARMPSQAPYLVPLGREHVGVRLASGTDVVARLPPGNYATAGLLAEALEAALVAAAGGAQTFAAGAYASLDSLWIRSSAPFSIDVARVHPATAEVLGLGPSAVASSHGAGASASPPRPPLAARLSSSGDGTGNDWLLEAPFRASMDPLFRRCIVLRVLLPSAEALVSASQTVNRTFAILSHGDSYMYDHPYEKRWSPPVSRVSRAQLEFVDLFGDAYDFQNQEHALEFIFELPSPRSLGLGMSGGGEC